MQTFGIVALAFAVGILIAVLLAGIGVVIYYSRSVKIQSAVLAQKVEHFYAENSAALDNHRGQLVNITESAKSNLASTRQEMKTALDLNMKAIQALLDEHRKGMQLIADRINATALLEASKRGIEACQRLERVASSLWSWAQKLDEEREEPTAVSREWTEDRASEYAPADPNAPTIYAKGRPEDILTSEESADRIPIGL